MSRRSTRAGRRRKEEEVARAMAAEEEEEEEEVEVEVRRRQRAHAQTRTTRKRSRAAAEEGWQGGKAGHRGRHVGKHAPAEEAAEQGDASGEEEEEEAWESDSDDESFISQSSDSSGDEAEEEVTTAADVLAAARRGQGSSSSSGGGGGGGEGWEEEGEEDEESGPKEQPNYLTARHGFPAPQADEDGTFTDSDEEEWANPPRNRIGNIPIEWYDDLDHVGYDIHGRKIMKKKAKDALDTFIDRSDDPYDWRKVHDYVNDQDITLTEEEIELVNRVVAGKHADGSYDPYADYVEWFTDTPSIHPMVNKPEPKRRFQPSKMENARIMHIVRGLRRGTIKTKAQWEAEQSKEKPLELAWTEDEVDSLQDDTRHIAAPKRVLPSHAESYNPAVEFLPTEEERLQWQMMPKEDRPYNFEPTRYDALRKVPLYTQLLRENFERCLDLYLCPRTKKRKMNVDAEDLVPKLPKAADLKPFPTQLSMEYKGHTDMVRALDVHAAGQWLATGGADGTVRVWEVATGRCVRMWRFGSQTVQCVAWNPAVDVFVLAIAVGERVLLCNALVGSDEANVNSDVFLMGDVEEGDEGEGKEEEEEEGEDEEEQEEVVEEEMASESKMAPVVWKKLAVGRGKKDNGKRWVVEHKFEVKHVAWHRRGDYFSTTAPEGESRAVVVHQLSKRSTQNPFSKSLGRVQASVFHPTKPLFFVATQHYVRIYNLVRQELVKKLQTGVKYVSTLDVHTSGDHVLVGSFDKRVVWFDLDMGSKPYRTLRYHAKAVRSVAFHPRYPLFASSSDDCRLHVFHGRVYNDLTQNALIVPLKILRGHKEVDHVGVLGVKWHPTQPWLFSAGADNRVVMWM